MNVHYVRPADDANQPLCLHSSTGLGNACILPRSVMVERAHVVALLPIGRFFPAVIKPVLATAAVFRRIAAFSRIVKSSPAQRNADAANAPGYATSFFLLGEHGVSVVERRPLGARRL
jgi:hypothetical protein